MAEFYAREGVSRTRLNYWGSLLAKEPGTNEPQMPAACERGEFVDACLTVRIDLGGRGVADRLAWLMFFPEGGVRVHVYGKPVDM